MPRRRERSVQTAGAPGPPTEPRILLRRPGTPSGARTLIYYPDPSAGREPTPRLRLVRSRHVSTGTDMRTVVRLRWKARPPTAFNAGDVSALCHSRARGDFCQAVLLNARYQGAQSFHWHHPRHARQSATLVRHDSSATRYHNAYAVDPTVYAATYTASTGASPMGQVKAPLGQRVYSAMKRIR